MRLLLLPLIAIVFCFCALRAEAALLEYEGFDYPGSLGSSLHTLNGGTGWGANAWSNASNDATLDSANTSLAFPPGVGFTPAGAQLALTTTDTSVVATRTLGTGMNLATNGQVWYSSALFRRSDVSGPSTGIEFFNAANVRWSFGINETGNPFVTVAPGTQQATSLTPVEADKTYFLVAKIRTNTLGGSDEVFLRIFGEDDIVGNEPLNDADWDLTASGGSSVILNGLRLNMANSAGAQNFLDEFRVGTSWADVVNPVPEPGTISLIAASVLAIGYGWRRRDVSCSRRISTDELS